MKPLIIFTYAPAGLGHLRVTDTLYHGLSPTQTPPIILGADDTVIAFLHRFISVHYITRMLMEMMQKGKLQDVTTFLYSLLLRSHTKHLQKQMISRIQAHPSHPKIVLVIATHFGLAHQLAKIKSYVEKETDTKIFLVVQVTDDSPQHLWYVPGADAIFVPSHKTQKILRSYGASLHKPLVPIVVSPYPLSQFLKEKLPSSLIQNRTQQIEKDDKNLIHIVIPISGAAIGLSFFTKLLTTLHTISPRFIFHVVCKKAPFTALFTKKTKRLPYVRLYSGSTDRSVIDMYETLYKKNVISLEITKPSEQAFKALLDCERRGASLLLFTQPIGRQEEDNLDFLKRHFLIPQEHEQQEAWHLAEKNKEASDTLHKKAASWRGISLPKNPMRAAPFIWWCLHQDIFSAMMTCKVYPRPDDPYANELEITGVEEFWQKVSEIVYTSSNASKNP